jgi:protein phosphatase
MTPTLTVEAAGRTHVGLVRRRNEDAIYLGRSLLAVADGLGGHVAGDIASTTVIEAVRDHDREVGPADLADALGRAVNAANRALRRRIEATPQLAGMGSTLVAMLWSGTAAALGSVGDSRAYLRRGNAVTRLTEDHTYRHLVADAASVPDLPERLARWLDGRADGRSPDISVHSLRPDDRFLLCSDGLSSYVPRELIDATLRLPGGPGEPVDRLIALANDHGGPDNISVIVIDVRAT